MYLLIDLSVQDTIKLSLFNNEQRQDYATSGKNRELLFSIETFLNQEGVQPAELQGIAVVVGEGSFTCTRIAVTVANTFAYAHNIPVAGVSSTDTENLEEVIEKISTTPVGQYISATYSGEPNIGPPKK